MGAQAFVYQTSGESAEVAFTDLVKQAQWDHGHSGFSGTIAEKHEFQMLNDIPGAFDPEDPQNSAWQLLQGNGGEDAFWYDKWGPAACIDLGEDVGQRWLFFGWASS